MTGAFHFGSLSREAREGIILALATVDFGDLFSWVSLERAAWMFFVLRSLPDRPEWFPKGKWATLQEIERQLDKEAATK